MESGHTPGALELPVPFLNSGQSVSACNRRGMSLLQERKTYEWSAGQIQPLPSSTELVLYPGQGSHNKGLSLRCFLAVRVTMFCPPDITDVLLLLAVTSPNTSSEKKLFSDLGNFDGGGGHKKGPQWLMGLLTHMWN